MGTLLTKILRYCFSWIDSIVVKLISYIYKLLMDLAELVLYSDEVIDTLGKRIALLLGIFMLFKLATSIIGYIVSPDKFNDAQKGGSKLITNVVISLSLLVSINLIFKEAYNIQKTIVNSQIIEKIFFGNKANEVKNYSSNNNTSGSSKMDIGYYLYTGLFAPNNEVFGDSCDDLWDISKDVTTACEQKLIDLIGDGGLRTIYKARNTLDMSYIFIDYDVMLATSTINTKVFAFDYWPIISSVIGVLVLLILISFAMDIATRAIKLLFLQIIAPIPIISYMDVGKGQDIFQKWSKECINTYLTVFIRLIAINFAVFMIILVRGNWKDVFTHNVWMNIFIIVGCLMFAKQVPKLLEDFFGIKTDGLAINPLKKFQEQALFGKQVAGVGVGAVAGTAAGLRAMGANMMAPGTGGRILGAGAGFASAFSRSLTSGFRGEKFGKIFSNSYNVAMENKEKRVGRKEDDVKFWEMEVNKIQRAVHQKTRGQRADELNSAIDSFKQNGEAIKNAVYANDKANMSVNGQAFKGAKGLKEFIDNMQAPIQQVGETAAQFAARQKDFLSEKKKYQDALDLRVAEVASGVRVIDDGAGGAAGGDAANASVKKIITTMQEQRESINTEGKELYGVDFAEIESPTGFNGTVTDYDTTLNRTVGLKNSLGGAAGAQTTISSHAGHDRDVDKYGAKKDAK